jgi:hypothetical protein
MTNMDSPTTSLGAASVQRAARGPWVERLARVGLFARGVVYFLIGFLAIQSAVGGGNKEMDQKGAFHYVAAQPLGQFLLWALALGLFAYALWRLIQVITGQVDDPDPDKQTRERVVAAVKVVIYGFFGYTAAAIAANSGTSSTSSTTADIMKETGGQLLVGVVGAIIVVVGLFLTWQGWTTDFRKLLDTSRMSPTTQRFIIGLGRIGYVARGIVFALFGIFVIAAAVNFDPNKAEGLDVALSAIARAPAGPLLLGLVALGLMAFGIYSMTESKYRRV